MAQADYGSEPERTNGNGGLFEAKLIADQSVTDPSLTMARPLPLIGAAFTQLLLAWKDKNEELATGPFAEACDHISVLFQMLGMAFSFGGRDYIEKVKDLKQAANTFVTLPEMVDNDVENGSVRTPGSHTRNLLRIKRGLEMNRQLFLVLLEDSSVTLYTCATRAYAEVFGPYHSWAIRQAVGAGMYALPTKQQFLKKLQEDENSWRKGAEEYVQSSGPIIGYVENLFKSRNLAIDW